MQPTDVVQQVSTDLTDQEPGYEYARWPASQLMTFLQEAMVYVSRSLPDLFTETVVVKLEVGNVWQQACSCERIVRVLGESDATGRRILRVLRRLVDDESLVWQSSIASRCAYTSGSFQLESYRISATSSQLFQVYPPVPATEKKPHYVVVECYSYPDVAGGDAVPEEIVPVCKQWMLWRALAQDSENNSAAAEVAGRHRETFFKMLEDLRAIAILEEAEYGGCNNSVRPSQNGSSQ